MPKKGRYGAEKFAKRKEDAYDTPANAVTPLMRLLQPMTSFIEPCAGQGNMIRALAAHGHICVDAFDVAPRAPGIRLGDAMDLGLGGKLDLTAADCFVSNPPWTRRLMHPIIMNLSQLLPTWLLFDADWMHTIQAIPILRRCRVILSVGRVRWIEGTDKAGYHNAAWYLFTPTERAPGEPIHYIERTKHDRDQNQRRRGRGRSRDRVAEREPA